LCLNPRKRKNQMQQSLLNCPVCSGHYCKEINTSFRKCRNCGIIYNEAHRLLDYDDNYFTDSYRQQYGKSYIEDFNNIYSSGKRRIDNILQFYKQRDTVQNAALLDLGCATGFFLKAAEDSGINDLTGVEISSYAANYIQKNFPYKILNKSFKDIEFPRKYDIITAWFFIEHFDDTNYVLQKVFDNLRTGGIFAFSVPSFFGPSFLLDKDNWINTHPLDHRVDFSPASIKTVLSKYGFSVKKIVPSGIHPERVLNNKSLIYPLFKPVYKLFSDITAFSDTIEIYSEKN